MDRRRFLHSSFLAAAAVTTSVFPLATTLKALPKNSSSLPTPQSWSDDEVTACWIGHSTVLINLFGTVILTDPVLFNQVGIHLLGTTYGLTRLTKPALAIEDIPRPDVVLLSHGHMDHTDLVTLEAVTRLYPEQIVCVCARNTHDLVDDLPWKRVRELDWWDSLNVGNVSVTAIEVLHNGRRYPWEPDRREGNLEIGRSYNGYLLSCEGKNIVFGGDTAVTHAFTELKSLDVDCAILPIGAYKGFSENHCTPEEAVDLSYLFNSAMIAPIHCMTFELSAEPFSEPMQRFIDRTSRLEIRRAWTMIGETMRLGAASPLFSDSLDR